jgi:TonB family protein
VEANRRGARWSVLFGAAIAGLVILGALPLAAVAGDPSAEELAHYRARYQAALGDLWNGKPLEAIDPLYQLYQDGGCLHHKCEMRLAQAYRYLGEIHEAHRWAVSAVERAERKGLSGAEEYNELGICLFDKAKLDPVLLEESLAALRQSVARHSSPGDTYLYNLSQVLLVAGETDEAGSILQKFQNSEGLRPIIEKGEAVFGEYERLAVIDRKYAKYTLEAKRQGTEGQILIRALIDAHGKVADTEVLRGLPNGLTEEALQALRKSKFQPARLNGEPVGAIYHQSVDMRLTPALVSQHRIGGDSDNH